MYTKFVNQRQYVIQHSLTTDITLYDTAQLLLSVLLTHRYSVATEIRNIQYQYRIKIIINRCTTAIADEVIICNVELAFKPSLLVHAYGFSVYVGKLLFGYEVDVCRANVKFACNRQSRKKKTCQYKRCLVLT